MPATSEPACGSVTAMAAIASPSHSAPTQRSCCAAVPWRAMWGPAMYALTSAVTAMPPLARASSSDRIATASESFA